MNKIANKQVICEVLMEKAKNDKDVVVLCSDSRGSSSLTPYADAYPGQFVEVGIAEQSLVSISAGLARCGKKPYAASPACFLSTRSMEQAKVDCAYSHMNVKLIGVSGGVSYGALGMTHHSATDIADMASIPGMRVYLPSDRFQTRKLIEALYEDTDPAYVRVGRNAVEDVYTEDHCPFEMDKATVLGEGSDVAIIACGEMVSDALQLHEEAAKLGISVRVIDMFTVKPLDEEMVLKAARETGRIIVWEDHLMKNGLASAVADTLCDHGISLKSFKRFGIPQVYPGFGNAEELYHLYGYDLEAVLDYTKQLFGK